MAGFNIGGNGNEYDKFLAANNGISNQNNKTDKAKKPKKLTEKQMEQLRDAIKDGKLRPEPPKTKYGINLPNNETHTKYGINCSLPDKPTVNTKYGINCPPPSAQTKYGINFPQSTTHTKYGVNCPPTNK